MKKTFFVASTALILLSDIAGSKASEVYSFDDDGRISEIDMLSEKFAITYNNNQIQAKYFSAGSHGFSEYQSQVISNGDNTYTIISRNDLGSADGFIIDKNGKILASGYYYRGSDYSSAPWKDLYKYEYQDGVKVSRIRYNCSYVGLPTNCDNTSIQYYDYEYDDDGNIVAEYLVNNKGDKHSPGDQPVATHIYTDAYKAKQAAKKCNSTKSCTSCSDANVLQEGECVSSCGESFRLNDGECDRIRYTPAEAAEVLKDTDNEIIMTFKVNR